MKNEIGDFFPGHNIVEYKSPGDGLNLDTFYKVLGYACLYKYEAGNVDEILDTDITISLLREEKPRKLLEQLSQKYKVTERAPGVYRIDKMLFPLQILVTKELDFDLHIWLHSLTRSMEYKDAENLLDNYDRLENKKDRMNADVVVDFVSNVNETVFLQILKEGEHMTEAMKELVAPELKELRLVIDSKNAMIANQSAMIADQSAMLADKDAVLADKDAEIAMLRQQLLKARRSN